MTVNFTCATEAEKKQVLQWAEELIRKGADCTVEISGPAEPPKKDLAKVAKEVYAGVWGNGLERRMKLQAAGYTTQEIAKIQDLVYDLVYG